MTDVHAGIEAIDVTALDPETLTAEQFSGLLDAAGRTGGGALPTRMAEALRERLLLEFLGGLYHP